MTKSTISIDLDDPRTAKIAEVISNKTAKKVLSHLAEQEMSETELSTKLSLPLNTIGYNIKKLEASGLIEKTNKFLWSVKGKRIHKYKVSNRKIVISPKTAIRGILPAALISALIALGIKIFVPTQNSTQSLDSPVYTDKATDTLTEEAASGSAGIVERILPPTPESISTISSFPNPWAWFLLGALIALLIFLIFNQMKGGQKYE